MHYIKIMHPTEVCGMSQDNIHRIHTPEQVSAKITLEKIVTTAQIVE